MRSGAPRGAPGAAPRAAGLDAEGLAAKYQELCAKYEELVRRYSVMVEQRAGAVALALAAMRTSTSALALFNDGAVAAQNASWAALNRLPGEWHQLGRSHGRSWNSLHDLALEQARHLLGPRRGRGQRVARYEHGPTGRIVDLHAERGGRERTVAVIVHEITEQVRAERELDAARETAFEQQRMRAVGELASGVAHDLNNALHAMSMRLVVLRKGTSDGPQARSIEALERTVSDAAVRVGRLQEFAHHRQDAPHASVDLAALVRDALELAKPELEAASQAERGHIEVENGIGALPPVWGVAAELRHVFVNLLLNARDAMPRGGAIRLDGRVDGEEVVVTVADDGTGIPEENLSRVFEPFFTTKEHEGTGLGLAVAYGVMRRLGGSISAANRPEGGAVLTMRFRVATRAEVPSPAPRGAVPPGQRVLVVDDDEDNLEAMRLVLEGLGQEVATARSGTEAIARFAAGERFDLVLCDVGMPKMNGWQAAREIRSRAPDVRIHMLTGWAQEVRPDDPVRKLVQGVLAKPLEISELEGVLAAGGPPDEGRRASRPAPRSPPAS